MSTAFDVRLPSLGSRGRIAGSREPDRPFAQDREGGCRGDAAAASRTVRGRTRRYSGVYDDAYPPAVYEAGQVYCGAWPMKNHGARVQGGDVWNGPRNKPRSRHHVLGTKCAGSARVDAAAAIMFGSSAGPARVLRQPTVQDGRELQCEKKIAAVASPR